MVPRQLHFARGIPALSHLCVQSERIHVNNTVTIAEYSYCSKRNNGVKPYNYFQETLSISLTEHCFCFC